VGGCGGGLLRGGQCGGRRLAMVNNNITFDLHSLVNNPAFNFLNSLDKDDIDEDQNIFSSDFNDSPYTSSTFETSYHDPTSLINQIQNSNCISVMSRNIQSLSSKYGVFRDLILELGSASCCPDIICLQEVWTVAGADLFPLPGYQPLISKTRSTGQGGGGGLYIRTGLPFKLCRAKSVFIDKLYESIFIDITLASSKKLTIGSIYRPNTRYSTLTPSEQLTQFNDLLLNTLSQIEPTANTLIVGDINLDALKYGTNDNVTSYIDSLFTSGFLQTITLPTRCTSHSATLIDHAITNMPQTTFTNLILTQQISDHFPIFVLTNVTKIKKKKSLHTFTDFSANNIANFKANLANVNWDQATTSECPDIAYNSFHETFTNLHNFHFQPKTVKFNINFHKYERWMTQGLLTSRITKNKLSAAYSKNPSPFNHQKFTAYRNLYNNLIRQAKKCHFSNALSKNSKNLKKTWSLLNDALNKSKSHSPIHSLISNQTLITDPTQIANAFNSFFTTIAETTASQIPPVTDPEPPPPHPPPHAHLPSPHHLSPKRKYLLALSHWKINGHLT